MSFPDPVWSDVRQSSPVGVLQVTKMSTGAAKRRPRSTAGLVPFSLTFAPVTEAAFEEFIDFYMVELSMGALAFEMPHPILGGARQWEFDDEGAYDVSGLGDGVVSVNVNVVMLP